MTPMDDVVVAGGGPAGAVAALVLARAGHRVRVFERARFPRAKLCGDTLNPGALARLGAHLDLGPLRAAGLPLSGMRLSGPGGATVEGRYPSGQTGLAVTRAHLDRWLLTAAAAAGATVEEGVRVDGPVADQGRVRGVVVRGRAHHARLVIAAEGRGSRLAQACGLVRTPSAPRRWALGAYASDVGGTDVALGEMHVRAGRYLGIAPVAGGATNVCLVLGRADAAVAVRDPWAAIRVLALADPLLAPRLGDARPIGRPVVLGPMALDAVAAGVPGLLLAGDAAGFIDPMTGDGLRLAIEGGELAATIAGDVLDGRLAIDAAPAALAAARRQAFATKWRFNRGLRLLVDTPVAVRAAAQTAGWWPAVFHKVIAFAGDVPVAA
ncbi:MAG: FAD-dependent monooxygenase [Vicinamibacterales bacterium]